jgi:small subunit ribosomal protein S6e
VVKNRDKEFECISDSASPSLDPRTVAPNPRRTVADKVEKLAKIAKRTSEQAAHHKVIVARVKEERERRSESMAKKRAVRQASQASQCRAGGVSIRR